MAKTGTAAAKKDAKANAFAGLSDVLAGGFDMGLTETVTHHFAPVDLDDIEIEAQVRDEFENEDNTLAELGKSLKKLQAQNIIVRPNRPGSVKPYLLVAGERRVRGAKVEGLKSLWALIAELDDEQAAELQFIENVQRKNLTYIEEAKRIQADLDALGSTEAVLAKYNKSPAWLSKITSLLTLPEQAARVLKESISADMEVVGMVKQIEKADPKAAKALVDDLKKTRGKEDARKKAAAVKETVKPSKKKEKAKDGGTVATGKDKSHEEPGDVQKTSFADAKDGDEEAAGWPFQPVGGAQSAAPALAPAEALNRAYTSIFEKGSSPKTVLESMKKDDRANVETWLASFYDAGKGSANMSRAVIQGFRKGTFSTDGEGAFALLAFLQGADSEVKSFNVLNVFGLVKE